MQGLIPLSSTALADIKSAVTSVVTEKATQVLSMRQYDQSPILQAILLNLSDNFDSIDNQNFFYNLAWNIDTCEGVWLDIWGVKVGVNRGLQVPTGEAYFGFNETNHFWSPFNQGVFFVSEQTYSYSMTDEAYRLMIMAKAYTNISPCTAKSANALLKFLYADRGNCYVNDLGGMGMNYTFGFALEPWEQTILSTGGVLPKPAGVSVTFTFV